jgi:galactokinase/mevalonate kinase-like predicted kinase
MFRVKLPARINVLGNPSDANEGAHQTISAAINLWGTADVRACERLRLRQWDEEERDLSPRVLEADSLEALGYGAGFDLQAAAVKLLLCYSEELRAKAREKLPEMAFRTEIPRQSGLGGSTVLVLLTLLGLTHFYRLDPRRHNLYVLAELAQRAEEKELNITCGFADRYVPLFGGLAYIDYRGKVFHAPLKEEPYCTYEPLLRYVDSFPLVMCSTGVQHHSGDVHRPMRARYLEEYRQSRGDYEGGPFMVRIMKAIGDTAWRGKIALLEGDLARFGALMNENHRLVDEMMRYCGFAAGAGEANNRIIAAGLAAGALGAKLTGAGGGGSVFMLTPAGAEEEIAAKLREALRDFGYAAGQVFIPSLVREGGVIVDEGSQP